MQADNADSLVVDIRVNGRNCRKHHWIYYVRRYLAVRGWRRTVDDTVDEGKINTEQLNDRFLSEKDERPAERVEEEVFPLDVPLLDLVHSLDNLGATFLWIGGQLLFDPIGFALE